MTKTGILGPSSLVHLSSGDGGSLYLSSPEPRLGITLPTQ